MFEYESNYSIFIFYNYQQLENIPVNDGRINVQTSWLKTALDRHVGSESISGTSSSFWDSY
jgi:hypothetical protein